MGQGLNKPNAGGLTIYISYIVTYLIYHHTSSEIRRILSVIESGEVTYISQYRIHTENTPIINCTDTHMFTTFESIKT